MEISQSFNINRFKCIGLDEMAEETDILWNVGITLVANSFPAKRLCHQDYAIFVQNRPLSLVASQIRSQLISEARLTD